MTRTTRTLTLPALALTAALTVSACGATSSSAGPSGTPSSGTTTSASTRADHNGADAEFATDMVPHHAQAVTMADLALTTATDPAVRNLAARIKAAQDPEIVKMSGWLRAWGKPVPSTTRGHHMSQMGGMAGMSGMAGMMTDQQMTALSKMTGIDFDRMWLQMMVAHHQGAVKMAQTELSSGSSADAKTLAQNIITAQNAEITTMTGLLAAAGSR